MGSHHPSSGREVAWSEICLKKIIPAILLEMDGEGDPSEANRIIHVGEDGGSNKGEREKLSIWNIEFPDGFAGGCEMEREAHDDSGTLGLGVGRLELLVITGRTLQKKQG